MAANGFDKNKQRAVESGRKGGRKSSRAIPVDLKEARQVRSAEFESIVFRYMDSSMEDLVKLAKDHTLPVKDMMVIKIMIKGLAKGEPSYLNFLMDRTVGRVVEKVQTANLHVTKGFHDNLIEEIENDSKKLTP